MLPDRRQRFGPSPIPFGTAFVTWLAGWAIGMLLVASLILAAFGVKGDDYTIAELGTATGSAWLVMLAALAFTGQRHGDDLTEVYGVRFRPIDLAGIPLGVLVQVVVVPLVYVPLREIWPSTFSHEEIEERAQELADKAGGWNSVLLVLIVVIGAPIVEELVYRGLLQRSLDRAIGAMPAWVLMSMGFALVHPQPIEYPGLVLAGLAFGSWVAFTGRIGGAIITHLAFNATAVLLTLN